MMSGEPVSIQQFCNALIWAVTDASALDELRDGCFAFDASATTAGHTAVHQVAMVDVRSVEWRGARPATQEWEKLEFTMISLERRSDDWLVWLNLWDVSEVTIVCRGLQLDGHAVEGTGSWLQGEPGSASAS